MEPLYKGHIETLETVLYIEVILDNTVEPLYRGHIGTLEPAQGSTYTLTTCLGCSAFTILA